MLESFLKCCLNVISPVTLHHWHPLQDNNLCNHQAKCCECACNGVKCHVNVPEIILKNSTSHLWSKPDYVMKNMSEYLYSIFELLIDPIFCSVIIFFQQLSILQDWNDQHTDRVGQPDRSNGTYWVINTIFASFYA